MRSLNVVRLDAIKTLTKVSPTPFLDVDLLLCHVLKCDKVGLILQRDKSLSDFETANFEQAIIRRVQQEPIAYICGEKEFMGFLFQVSNQVLIPRPETEILVERVLERIEEGPPLRLLDMCTGSGAILLSLLKLRPNCSGVGADISTGALDIARKNCISMSLCDRANFVESDLFAKITDEKFDFIVSNPPYITGEEMNDLLPNVKAYEPTEALFGGEDGLCFYRRIIEQAPKFLRPEGWLAFEIGYKQRDAVVKLIVDADFEDVTCYNDLSGHNRVVVARLKPNRG